MHFFSLPTGAGKTRVTAQALIEQMAERIEPTRILWVAETDELCEQAVQTWQYVWRAMGPRRPLLISRLWSQNEAEDLSEDQLVVATIDKLDHCIPGSPPTTGSSRHSAW